MIELIKKAFTKKILKTKMYRYKILFESCDGKKEFIAGRFTDKSIRRFIKDDIYSECGCYIKVDGDIYYKNQIKKITVGEIIETKDLYTLDYPLENLFYRYMTAEEIDNNNKRLKNEIEKAYRYNKVNSRVMGNALNPFESWR